MDPTCLVRVGSEAGALRHRKLVPNSGVGEWGDASENGSDERRVDAMGFIAVPVRLEEGHRTGVLTKTGLRQSDLATESRIVADGIFNDIRESGLATGGPRRLVELRDR